MKLNLGSGADYQEGWVNLDRWLDSTHHRGETRLDLLADAHILPFKDDSFERIKMRHSLEHFAYPLVVLFECRRVLDGTMYTEVPNPFNFIEERKEHLYSWSKSTLIQIHEYAGFEVIEYSEVGKNHYVEVST